MAMVARFLIMAVVLVVACIDPALADEEDELIPVSCAGIDEEGATLTLGQPPVWTGSQHESPAVFMFIPTGIAPHRDNQTVENGTGNNTGMTVAPNVGIGEDPPTLTGFVVVAWICALIEDIKECLGQGTVDGLLEAAQRFVDNPSTTNACLPV